MGCSSSDVDRQSEETGCKSGLFFSNNVSTFVRF